MIASDEPGYYLENEFGIRLETDIESVITPTKVLSFFFAFKYDFGIQTLGVSGRYQINPEDNSYNQWKYIRIISSLYNADIYVHKTLKDNFKIIAWAYDRRNNIIQNITQQLKRFYN